jgi:hypothetical protein
MESRDPDLRVQDVGTSGCSGQMSVFHQGESNHYYLQVGFQSS